MALVLMGLQSALMVGNEPTFDGQKMQPGAHYRWSFAPELGFPPGGFWLCRKPSSSRGDCLEPPEGMLWDQQVDACLPAGDAGPDWGEADWEGWQVYSSPFVLPVTVANWPARYSGAPDPSDPTVVLQDVAEANRRLAGLEPQVGTDLRNYLARLVSGFPGSLLFDQGIDPPDDAAVTPSFALSQMDYLLLLATNPLMARVLGLYTVLPNDGPEGPYDYGLIGRWNGTPCAARLLTPGAAPARDLAQRQASIGGAQILGSGALVGWNVSTVPQGFVLEPGGPTTSFSAVVGGVVNPPSAVLVALPAQPGPGEVCQITLPRPAAEVGVQLAGTGSVAALANGQVLATQSVQASILGLIVLQSPSPSGNPIDTLVFTSAMSLPVAIGNLALRPATGAIGTLWAPFLSPALDVALPAPATPTAQQRQRDARVPDPPAPPQLAVTCVVEVEWNAPPPDSTKDPEAPSPPANRPIGFVADRIEGAQATRLPGTIAPVAANVPVPGWGTLRIYRFMDRLPDPGGALSYCVYGFDSFGMLGNASAPSAPLAMKLIPAPPTVRFVRLVYNASGVPTAEVTLWWSGASLVTQPDTRSARVVVEGPDESQLAAQDIALPAPTALALTLSDITPGASTQALTLSSTSPLPDIPANLPCYLELHGQSVSTGLPLVERYAVVPTTPTPPPPTPTLMVTVPYNPGSAGVAGQSSSALTSSPAAFLGRAAYLILGHVEGVSLPLPSLSIPVDETTARCRVYAQSDPAPAFPPDTPILPDAPDFPPASIDYFTAAQQESPTTPEPTVPAPTHTVHHEYYDPPDFYGLSRRQLPFAVSPPPGGGGYVLLRAPGHALYLSDFQRRQAVNQLDDPNPAVHETNGQLRADLETWIGLLTSAWLPAYNARRHVSLSPSEVFTHPDAQRAFFDHFYSGLLDDELRALADVAGNAGGFSRVNADATVLAAGPVTDTIEGPGYARVLYKLQAVNKAGNTGNVTGSCGPYYTSPATPPRAPVLFKVMAQGAMLVVAWALSPDPDVGGYLVYRTTTAEALGDLRYFVTDPSGVVDPTLIAPLLYQAAAWPPLVFGAGQVDPRIVALVPDPRLFARDYDGSDMAEVVLPAGVQPVGISGVYRAAEYDATLAPDAPQPQAFNYFVPPAQGGTAMLVTSLGQARVTGLRVGLGRGVPVVVVVTTGGGTRVLGALPVQRAAFVDAGTAGDPGDGNALGTWTPPDGEGTNVYTVVAVDRFGNRSQPAAPCKVPPFQP